MKKKILIISLFTLLTQHTLHSQWIPQSIPVNKPIIGIDFADENTGWAITENTSLTDTAYILNTTNGGTNWNVQYGGNVALNSMDAININICYAGGSDINGDAIFLKTTNGGLNWTVNNIGANKVPDDMFFLNRDSGYICDNFSGGLYLTTDAGKSWLNRENGLTVFPRTLFFLNYDTGYCGGGFKLFKTINAGMDWNEDFNFGLLGNRIPLVIQFLSASLGWIGLNNNGLGITTNGGLNWSLAIPNSSGSYEFPGLFFENDSIGWVGPDYSASIYKSTNSGYNWIRQNDPSGSRAITFINIVTGWSGNNGISKTTNGGLTFIIAENNELTNSFKLNQNYPNPFNPTTKIRFTITEHSDVTFGVYDILGREIFNWKSDQSLQAGTYEYEFNGSNLSSGVYIYKLTAKQSGKNAVYSDTKKMILLR